MKKKKLVGGAIAAAIMFGSTLSGCTLVSTNAEINLKQTIADVNITQAENFEENAADYTAYSGVITTANVSRRDLISYFLNTGYSYVQSGYSYETVFNMLIESLTETETVAQYATLYLLDVISEQSSTSAVLAEYNALNTEQEKYIYLLENTQELGSQINRVNLATYSLYYSINSSIDSYEQDLIEEEDEDTGSDSRTTPTNVDTEVDSYYPANEDGSLNYGIYTGYSGYLLADSGEYQDDKIEGTNRTLRSYAYNQFVKSLKANYLVGEDEDSSDILQLEYIQEEYTNQLQYQVIEQYFDIYETQLKEDISTDDYLTARYNELLNQQSVTYSDADSFETALDSMASDSFVLYAPDTTSTGNGTFGFVYNILLPFSQSQSNTLAYYSDLLDNDSITESEYYTQRNKLLKNITTTDQRTAWFTGTTDYSFDASETDLSYYNGGNSERTYLFFENNLIKTDRYEELENYIGLYSYNGTVAQADDGSYILTPEKLTIDGMLEEFVGYVNYVLDDDTAASYTYKFGTSEAFYEATDFYEEDSEEIDYTNFIYATGKVNIDSDDISNLFVKGSTQYLALSAVNELQYAYTTDTSVLSQYIGYSVSAYDTSYIAEFEAAAKEAIENGAGTFYVLAGDYGWHIIYVTATFNKEGGAIYGESIDWSLKDTEGTFAYMFYEYIKDSDLDSATTTRRSQLISFFTDDNSVVLYEDAYSDLLELDS